MKLHIGPTSVAVLCSVLLFVLLILLSTVPLIIIFLATGINFLLDIIINNLIWEI